MKIKMIVVDVESQAINATDELCATLKNILEAVFSPANEEETEEEGTP